MASGDPVRSKWADYRRRRRLVVALFLGFFPALIIASTSLARLTGEDWTQRVAGGYVVVYVVAGLWWSRCPCPRCGRPFNTSGLYGNAFARKCLHCELPLWSDPDV